MKFLLTLLILFPIVSGCSSAVRNRLRTKKKKITSQAFESPEFAKLGLRFPLIERRLPNGLKILIVEDHTFPVVAFQKLGPCGSVDEKFGLSGMAHFLNTSCSKILKNLANAHFLIGLEAKGAAVNAFTTRDYTVFS